MTQNQLEEKIEAIGEVSDQQKKGIICSLIGHSSIIETCFGYVHCGRCGAQIGDQLGGCFDASKSVIIGHNCDTCQANYKQLDWKDKFMTPNPFEEVI